MTIENKQIVTNLGDAAEKFSEKGITFLRLRSNGKQGDIASKMIAALAKGSLKIPVKLNEDVSKEFGYTKMTPPMLAVIVLGRPPVRARAGGIQESGKVLTPTQRTAGEKIATAVKADLYANRQRKTVAAKAKSATTAKAKSATATKPQAKKKAVAKKPTVKKSTAGAKTTVRKPATKKTGTSNTPAKK